MPVLFKAKKSTIADKEGNKKWYPQLVKIGKPVETQHIAELIAERSSLSVGDTHNVMRNLAPVMKELLTNGRSISIDGLGTFRMTCRSRGGVETAEDVNAAQIKSLRIVFTPTATRSMGSATTRAMYTGVEYVRYDPATRSSTSGDGDGGSGGGNGGGSGNPDDEFIDPTA